MVKRFFELNVCIPKGKNRHPDADAIHQLAERILVVEIKSNEPSAEWGIEGIDDFSYRIKPSGPIYEYKYTTMSCGIRLFTEYMTDKEFQDSSLQYDYWVKLEETKQERK